MSIDITAELRKVNLAVPTVDLFDGIAERVAQGIAEEGDGKKNKSTQVRKFYDEFELWNQRIQEANNPQAKLNENLPYIMMLRAKCANAANKKNPLISRGFVAFITKCLSDTRDTPTPATLMNAKLFFECVVAFGKQFENKGH